MLTFLSMRERFLAETDSKPMSMAPHPLSFMRESVSASCAMFIEAWHDQLRLRGFSALKSERAKALSAMMLSSAKKMDFFLEPEASELKSDISATSCSTVLDLMLFPSKAKTDQNSHWNGHPLVVWTTSEKYLFLERTDLAGGGEVLRSVFSPDSYLLLSSPFSASSRRPCQTPSASPITTESANSSASSGHMDGCIPPSTVFTPLFRKFSDISYALLANMVLTLMPARSAGQ